MKTSPLFQSRSGLRALRHRSLLLAALALPLPALAGPGHDHGEAPAASSGVALPRFNATSELFELVGVLKDRQLTLYLDHAASNTPVKDATLDLEWAGAKLKTEAHGEGEFIATLPETPKPGVIAIAATVTAGKDIDLLAGELDPHTDAGTSAASHRGIKTLLPWAGLLAALAALALWIIKRRRNRGAGEFA